MEDKLAKYHTIEKVLELDVDLIEEKISKDQIDSESLSDLLHKIREIKS